MDSLLLIHSQNLFGANHLKPRKRRMFVNLLRKFSRKERLKFFRWITAENGIVSKEIEETITNLKGKIVHGRPRHPQSQGVVERVNQTLKKMLYNYPTEWSTHLPEITSAYNSTRHSTTGFAPIHAETGMRPIIDRSYSIAYVDHEYHINNENTNTINEKINED